MMKQTKPEPGTSGTTHQCTVMFRVQLVTFVDTLEDLDFHEMEDDDDDCLESNN